MSSVRPGRCARVLVLALLLGLVVSGTTACNLLPGGVGGDQPQGQATAEAVVDHGLCLPTYSSGVRAVSMSRDGRRILYLSDERPTTLSEGTWWGRDDRALYSLTVGADGMVTDTNVIAYTWPDLEENVIQVWPTSDPDALATTEPPALVEQMVDAALAPAGDRFVVAVSRKGVSARYAKLYAGTLPQDDAELAPGAGLTLIPINDYKGTEGVRSFTLSEDGTKLAAVVGDRGELRVYDFAQDKLYVYSRGEGGAVDITNELPQASTTIASHRVPALAHEGVFRLTWSPDGTRLAAARTESVGVAGVWLLDVATGQASLVRSLANTTVPQVVWAADGGSLFVLSTQFISGTIIGNSEVRRLTAAENGKEIGDRWQLTQLPGYRTAPADFGGFGDDTNFVFTWEKQLWLLQLPASGTGKASYGPVTREPSEMVVSTGTVSVSGASDSAAFVVVDDLGPRLGQRLYLTAQDCPLEGGAAAGEESAATEGDVPAEGAVEGEGDFPAEGEEAVPAEGAVEGEGDVPAEGESGGAEAPAAETPVVEATPEA